VSLRELRERLGVTQATVARGADMSQGDVSRLERRTDWLYTSLERYAAGMGGHLELYIVVNGQRYLVDP